LRIKVWSVKTLAGNSILPADSYQGHAPTVNKAMHQTVKKTSHQAVNKATHQAINIS
jgi:hypothetical protein